jgi:arylsulfatase A-like enzyme
MSDESKPDGKKLDRRSLLIGAAAGVAGTAALAAGAGELKKIQRTMATPKSLPNGAAPEIALSFADSHSAYNNDIKAPAGAPNIITVILDDVGFSDLGCYGSEIPTPNFDALGAKGLRYANFRTTAMCSPTRAVFHTGLNHHSAGMGWLADIDSGYPGYRGDMTHDAATIAETLRDAGWSTFLLGKWHLNNVETTGATGPYHNWPTSRGYERAYWFQGHSTDYFKPGELFDGVAPVEPPDVPDYYVLDDLTDRAISYINTQHAMAPAKPFFLNLAYPGAHSPLQVRGHDRDRHKGKYDSGWDEIRAGRLARQKTMGLLPDTTQLPPLSTGAHAWTTLTPLQQKVYARYMEVYAGIISNLDDNVGRLMAALGTLGVLENTLILVFSDNGASPEGTETGTPNLFASIFGREVPLEQAAELYDVMGEAQTFPHYPIGWACASNTPYRKYKQYVHLGGVADPLIVSWPKHIEDAGAIRRQFVHVVDLFPTLLEAAKIDRPATYQGRPQKPLEGASAFATLRAADAATRTEQYYELGGMRAIQSGNWRLTAEHERGEPFESDKWGLYDMSHEPNELTDVSVQNPDVVKRLIAQWNDAALRYGVLPLDDRALLIKMVQDRQRIGIRPDWDLRPPIERLAHDVGPAVCGFDHTIDIDLIRPAGAGDGVLVAQGSRYSGWVLYIADGKLIYETSMVPWVERIVSPDPLPEGKLQLRYKQAMTTRPFEGSGAIFVNGLKVAERKFDRCIISPSYDGLSVGADLGGQVSVAYHGANPFQGKIERVQIAIDNRGFSALETMHFMREIMFRQ